MPDTDFGVLPQDDETEMEEDSNDSLHWVPIQSVGISSSMPSDGSYKPPQTNPFLATVITAKVANMGPPRSHDCPN